MAGEKALKMSPDPPLSQPRRGSTAPTFDLHPDRNPGSAANPLWELSSFSEAAMAAVQALKMSPDPLLNLRFRRCLQFLQAALSNVGIVARARVDIHQTFQQLLTSTALFILKPT
ncbi:hypothetical protein, partial [Pseudomonas brenneri]|uniref:hypothetical protein n=2 Tax=Pseudomonas brenneri TaxID=129817 RepID=UPI003B9F6422